MKVKSRILSFIIVAVIYFLAAAVGVIAHLFLPFPFWLNLLIADVIATIYVFLFSLIFSNASMYDPYWSVQPIVILIGYACVSEPAAANVLPLLAVIFWGIRLTANWAYTFHGLEHQDWRYTMLKEKTGKLYPLVNFFGIHLVPTLIVYGCTLPAVFTYVYQPDFNIGSLIFFAVSIFAIVLQGIADCTMHKFRKGKNRGFIRAGVWKYSRHPNYLGEILMWWGIGLAAVCVMPQYWWLIAGAVANTLLFLFISIPLADNHQARKPGFEKYKKNTRMLLPIYKKQS